jgi:hypothetical protein
MHALQIILSGGGDEMAQILIAGGFNQNEPDPPYNPKDSLDPARKSFCEALGRELISRGHTYLGGCCQPLDAVVAGAAHEKAVEDRKDPEVWVRSYLTEGTKQAHRCGRILHSYVTNWRELPKGYRFPEAIKKADVAIFIGGWDGTQVAATWARLAGLPLVPVATLGMESHKIFKDEISQFDKRYGALVEKADYEVLSRVLPDQDPETLREYAIKVLSLAEKIVNPREVFVIFSTQKGIPNVYRTIEKVCKDSDGYNARKADDHVGDDGRIIPAILEGIRRSAFVVADLSSLSPNVYYELGYAQALGKRVLVTAQGESKLPFDVSDLRTIFWKDQEDLRTKLKERFLSGFPRVTPEDAH